MVHTSLARRLHTRATRLRLRCGAPFHLLTSAERRTPPLGARLPTGSVRPSRGTGRARHSPPRRTVPQRRGTPRARRGTSCVVRVCSRVQNSGSDQPLYLKLLLGSTGSQKTGSTQRITQMSFRTVREIEHTPSLTSHTSASSQELEPDNLQSIENQVTRYRHVAIAFAVMAFVASLAATVLAVVVISRPRKYQWDLDSRIPSYSGNHILPRLPILNATLVNRLENDEWHAYFERVFGHPVRENVDLNSFNWLYNFAPLYLYNVTPISLAASACDLGDGCVWFSTDLLWVLASYRHYGFFVTRNNVRFSFASAYTEVLHHTCPSEDNELSEAWFFVSVGSGVFVNSAFVQRTGRHYPNSSREEVTMRTNIPNRNSGCIADIQYTTGFHGGNPCSCDVRLRMANCYHPIAPLLRRELTNVNWC